MAQVRPVSAALPRSPKLEVAVLMRLRRHVETIAKQGTSHVSASRPAANVSVARRFAPPMTASGLPSTADIAHRDHHFRKVPIPDSCSAANGDYSIISSAVDGSDCAMASPIAALSKLLKPPTSQREGPCMLEHHEAGRAF